MATKVRPPSRFVAWLGLSTVLAAVATVTTGILQLGLIGVALLPALAVAARGLQQRRPSFGQPIALAVVLLLASGEPLAAAAVLSIGEALIVLLDLWLRAYVDRAHESVPTVHTLVRVERLNREELVPYASLKVGERVIVNPGERVPVDGRLIGRSARVRPPFDLGELKHLAPGERLVSGSVAVNQLVMEVLHVGPDVTTSILRGAIQQVTQQLPPPLARLDRMLAFVQVAWSLGVVAWYFVDGASASAAWFSLTGTWWFGTLLGRLAWLRLVAHSAARGLILTTWEVVLRSRYLRTAVFGKTGTVTTGMPHLLEVVCSEGVKREDVLRIALALEATSDHAIAHTLKHLASDERLVAPAAEKLSVQPSLGIVGSIEQESFAVGSSVLMGKLEVVIPEELVRQAKLRESQGATTVYVTSSERVLGLLVLKDVVRPSAQSLVHDLREHGFEQVQLVSGDSSLVTRSVAATLGVPPGNVSARMTAARKEQHIKQLPRSETLVIAHPESDQAMLAAGGLAIAFNGSGPSLKMGGQILLQRANLSDVAYTVRALKRVARAWWSAPITSAVVTALATATVAALRFF